MTVKGKKVLVTGAAGFIGSHLVEALLKQGADVRAFIRYNSRSDFGMLEQIGPAIQDVEIVAGDLRDGEAVRKAIKGCHIVFHLGALISIPYSYQGPRDVIDVNVRGTQNVLDAALQLDTERVIVTSTSEVFGSPEYTPIDLKHPLRAQSPYAASKIAADKLAESYHLSFDLPVSVLRPFNTFGPRQSARAVIPTIIMQALTSNNVRVGNTAPRRDMLFVEDTAAGFISMAEGKNAIGKTLQIGSGKDHSIGEIIQLVGGILGKELVVEEEAARVRPDSSEVKQLLCDYSEARELLGWEPRISFEDGLHRVVDYISANLDAYKVDRYHV